MDATTNLTKVCLKRTHVFLHGVQGGTLRQFTSIMLEVLGFFRSAESYFRNPISEEKYRCTAVINKKTGCVNVTVKINDKDYRDIMECYLFYDRDIYSEAFRGKMISKDSYYVDVPSEIINNPKNEFKEQDKLKILFISSQKNRSIPMHPTIRNRKYYETYHEDSLQFSKITLRRPDPPAYEEDEISKHLNVWNKKLFRDLADFTIRVQNDKIHVHKALLASRSTYFNDYIDKNCKKGKFIDIKIDTTVEAMKAVVSFLYTGKMVLQPLKKICESSAKKHQPTIQPADQSLEKTIPILELSITLNLKGLECFCRSFLEENINEDNMHQIERIGSRCDVVKSIVKDFKESNKAAMKAAKKKSTKASKRKKYT